MPSSGAAVAVDILTYHSISEAGGPTSIPPELFEDHLRALDASGCTVVPLAALADWHDGEAELPERCVVITFDDGFRDFLTDAHPRLDARGWPATVFLPTSKVGGREDWHGAHEPARPLLSWPEVQTLAGSGVAFGAHSVSHPDLTRLPDDALEHEIMAPKAEIAARLGAPPLAYAPPYGRSGRREHRLIRQHYRLAVGTRLARAGRTDDPVDLPRIEMHYFRDLERWRRYLDRRERWYFEARRALRRLREAGERALGA